MVWTMQTVRGAGWERRGEGARVARTVSAKCRSTMATGYSGAGSGKVEGRRKKPMDRDPASCSFPASA